MKREEMLRNLIVERYGNIKEFSRRIDLPYTTVRSILERGVSNAKVENVITMCKGLGLSAEELITEDDLDLDIDTGKTEYFFYPNTVSAGFPMIADGVSVFERIELPDVVMGKYAGDKFILIMRINGDSMNKIIPHGSLIAVKGVSLHSLKDGDIVVYSHMNEYSVKQIFKVGNKVIFKPMSTNPAYTDYVVDIHDDELAIHGKVVVYIVEK